MNTEPKDLSAFVVLDRTPEYVLEECNFVSIRQVVGVDKVAVVFNCQAEVQEVADKIAPSVQDEYEYTDDEFKGFHFTDTEAPVGDIMIYPGPYDSDDLSRGRSHVEVLMFPELRQ